MKGRLRDGRTSSQGRSCPYWAQAGKELAHSWMHGALDRALVARRERGQRWHAGTHAVVRPPTVMWRMRSPVIVIARGFLPQRRWKSQPRG